MGKSQVSDRQGTLSSFDLELGQVAATFRRYLMMSTGLAAAAALAATSFYQPASALGLALVVVVVVGTALMITAIIALVRHS